MMEDDSKWIPGAIYPIGIQDFSDLRQRNAAYVDKTGLVYLLSHQLKYVFLSRPRRFGKSLLCSTLKYYFEGRKELFEGLIIDRLEKDWTVYPVLHFDMSRAKNQLTLQGVIDELGIQLSAYEGLYGSDKQETSPGKRLLGIIRRAYEKTGRGVVVILDEYDAPLLDVLHKDKELEEVRRIMQEFYSPLKPADPYLRFCFITGITKFSQLSIFSTINNLSNISMDDSYSAICGITETELHTCFQEGIAVLGKELGCSEEEVCEKLKAQYDGYHFSKKSEDVYNPFSLLNALSKKDIASYWFSSGTPSYLIRQLKKYKTDLTDLDNKRAAASQFDVPTEAMTTALPLLYQSGYVTIKEYDPRMNAYTLAIPNKEVRVGLAESLLPMVSGMNTDQIHGIMFDFCDAVWEDDIDKALSSMKSYLAGIPYPDGGKEYLEDEEKAEWHYAQVFYLLFSFMNANIYSEVRSARGRADMVMYAPEAIYVFELKINRPADEALRQIDEKGYMLPYKSDGRKLVKVGVSFSTKTRTLEEWKIG